jgi:hypothetical protein
MFRVENFITGGQVTVPMRAPSNNTPGGVVESLASDRVCENAIAFTAGSGQPVRRCE